MEFVLFLLIDDALAARQQQILDAKQPGLARLLRLGLEVEFAAVRDDRGAERRIGFRGFRLREDGRLLAQVQVADVIQVQLQ